MQPTKPTILVVEDDRAQREGLERALHERYEVLLAEDAPKAMQALESKPVDVLLTDLKMPGVDGLSSRSSLRQWRGSNQPSCSICVR